MNIDKLLEMESLATVQADSKKNEDKTAEFEEKLQQIMFGKNTQPVAENKE